jgi:nucleoside-diphosphate-sugar epimerase
MAHKVLVTGAFGHIGSLTVRHLIHAGHRVVALDLKSAKTEQVAAGFGADVEVMWGNICDADIWDRALQGVDTVVHMAAIIPPVTDWNPELAIAVNQTATINLLAHMEASATAKRLIFASSMVVAGDEQYKREPPLKVDEPPQATDVYGKTKVACEKHIQESALHWSILRIAACPPMGLSFKDIHNLEAIFQTSAKGRIEVVHVDDAALAFANAVSCDEAIGKVLFIGGGESCRSLALPFYNTVFSAMGLNPIKSRILRPEPIHSFGDWLDTGESQRLLRFQRHSLDDLTAEIKANVGLTRSLLRLCAPIVNVLLEWRSPYSKSAH